jgi:TPR repeat protein
MYEHGDGVKQDFISAYMWFNIDAANGNAHAVKASDAVVKKLTKAQMRIAQKRAKACQTNNYKNC